MIGLLIEALAVVLIALDARRCRRRAERLRNGLMSACNCCYRCHGEGRIALAGAWMSCPICSRWRQVLKETL